MKQTNERVCGDCVLLLKDHNPDDLVPASGEEVSWVEGERWNEDVMGFTDFANWLCDHHIQASEWLGGVKIDDGV